MRYSAVNPMTLFTDSKRVQTDVGRCNRHFEASTLIAIGASHLPQLPRCGLCGRASSPPQGKPVRASVTVGGLPAQVEEKLPSHRPPISRVDGILIDDMSFRDKHYLS